MFMVSKAKDDGQSLSTQVKMSRPDSLRDACDYYYNKGLSSAEIKLGRETIAKRWIAKHRTADLRYRVSEHDLTDLFNLYDETFFAGAFRKRFADKDDTFRIVPTERFRSVAGMCAYDPQKTKYTCTYWIELAMNVFAQTFPQGQDVRSYRINGLLCHCRLECLQMTLEHEIIHLLMYLWIKCNVGSKTKSGIGGHGPSFKRLAFNIFGHLETKHELFEGITTEEPLSREMKATSIKSQLKIGQRVQIKGDVFTIIKLNPTRFRVQNITKTVSYDVPYEYSSYTLLT